MILSLYQELNSTDCITEHTEDEGLGTNNDDKSWNFSVAPLSERNSA